MDLLVVRPFGSYGAGDRIADANTIAEVLASENAVNVVRVSPAAHATPADRED